MHRSIAGSRIDDASGDANVVRCTHVVRRLLFLRCPSEATRSEPTVCCCYGFGLHTDCPPGSPGWPQ
eukprot:6693555-Pyramimonas_sp.AAC.1